MIVSQVLQRGLLNTNSGTITNARAPKRSLNDIIPIGSIIGCKIDQIKPYGIMMSLLDVEMLSTTGSSLSQSDEAWLSTLEVTVLATVDQTKV